MPYRKGHRLAGERASKLGHLDVIKSDLVNELIEQFESPDQVEIGTEAAWESINAAESPLRLIFAVDGSIQTIRSDVPPYKELSFIKTALLRLDKNAYDALDQESPHPMALRDIMSDAAMYHATVLPMKGLRIGTQSTYHTVRRIIFDSLNDESLGGEPFLTLKWLAYEKWTGANISSPSFECPHCGKVTRGLPYNADEGNCQHCSEEVLLTDMIGFHLEMGEDSMPESVATAYMLIHETLLLFTGIRYFWEREKFQILQSSLFLKDGPLTLRSQYSKLVIPIRNFLEHAKSTGVAINIAGQEKTGTFVDHLDLISKSAEPSSVFIPTNEYIRREIQHRPDRFEPYGYRTNYGNKIFVKIDAHHHLVLSIPTGEYMDTSNLDDFIGIKYILATLPGIVSHLHEGALVPIVLVNGVTSLSSYPSATILKIFADI